VWNKSTKRIPKKKTDFNGQWGSQALCRIGPEGPAGPSALLGPLVPDGPRPEPAVVGTGLYLALALPRPEGAWVLLVWFLVLHGAKVQNGFQRKKRILIHNNSFYK
jgi:hypothetical protein